MTTEYDPAALANVFREVRTLIQAARTVSATQKLIEKLGLRTYEAKLLMEAIAEPITEVIVLNSRVDALTKKLRDVERETLERAAKIVEAGVDDALLRMRGVPQYAAEAAQSIRALINSGREGEI